MITVTDGTTQFSFRADTCTTLGAFSNEVHAQSGKSITTSQATQFLQQASQIQSVLGC
jgi:hypothetical protein